jgi:hypothetical protein
MDNKRPTQCQRLIEYLLKYKSVDDMEALINLSIRRLPSRIFELKSMGYIIDGKMETVKNKYGEKCRVKRYFLVDFVE